MTSQCIFVPYLPRHVEKSVTTREIVSIRENVIIVKHIFHIGVFYCKIFFTVNELCFSFFFVKM